jgi:hypothetical protein
MITLAEQSLFSPRTRRSNALRRPLGTRGTPYAIRHTPIMLIDRSEVDQPADGSGS